MHTLLNRSYGIYNANQSTWFGFVYVQSTRALLTCLKVKGLVIHRYGKGILLLIIDADQRVL